MNLNLNPTEPDRVQPDAHRARQKRTNAMPGSVRARRWTLDFDLMDCVGFHVGSGCTVKARSRRRRQEGPGTTLKLSPVSWGDGGGAQCALHGRGGGGILLQWSVSSDRNTGETLSTLDNVPGFHEAPDPLAPAGVAKNMDTGEIERADFEAHERGEALPPVCTVTAIAEGITGIEPAGEAERAAAAKSEALVPWAQGVARRKVEKFP